jgi:hypothetical protein
MINEEVESNLTLRDVKRIFSRMKRDSNGEDC